MQLLRPFYFDTFKDLCRLSMLDVPGLSAHPLIDPPQRKQQELKTHQMRGNQSEWPRDSSEWREWHRHGLQCPYEENAEETCTSYYISADCNFRMAKNAYQPAMFFDTSTLDL